MNISLLKKIGLLLGLILSLVVGVSGVQAAVEITATVTTTQTTATITGSVDDGNRRSILFSQPNAGIQLVYGTNENNLDKFGPILYMQGNIKNNTPTPINTSGLFTDTVAGLTPGIQYWFNYVSTGNGAVGAPLMGAPMSFNTKPDLSKIAVTITQDAPATVTFTGSGFPPGVPLEISIKDTSDGGSANSVRGDANNDGTLSVSAFTTAEKGHGYSYTIINSDSNDLLASGGFSFSGHGTSTVQTGSGGKPGYVDVDTSATMHSITIFGTVSGHQLTDLINEKISFYIGETPDDLKLGGNSPTFSGAWDGKFSYTFASLPLGKTYYLDIKDSSQKSLLPDILSAQTIGVNGNPDIIVTEVKKETTKNSAVLTFTISAAVPQTEPISLRLMWDTNSSHPTNSNGILYPSGIPPVMGPYVAHSSTIPGLNSGTKYYYSVVGVEDNHTYLNGSFSTDDKNGAKVEENTYIPSTDKCVQSTRDEVQKDGTTKKVKVMSDYCLIEPLPGLERVDTASHTAYADYLNKLITLAIGIGAVLAVIMIIIAGIQYMGTESVFGKGEDKNKIQNAILGLVILLGSFLILKTINPNLLQLGPAPETLAISVDGVDSVAKAVQFKDGTFGFTDDKGNVIDIQVNGKSLKMGDPWPTEDAAIRSDLGKIGVTVNRNPCLYYGQGSPDFGRQFPNLPNDLCTSLYFDTTTLPAAKGALAKLRSDCGCNFEITGGSETWFHSNNTAHRPSSSTFDFHPSEGLNKYITAGSTSFPKDGILVKGRPNGDFLPEQKEQTKKTTAEHWHATIQNHN